ncbi:glycosyltransferase [Empedobacter falsenii]|uniref:glycosyltransferase n=1 Tax=Empedobacter falsenii TaxID=343874 RepID=UPI003A80E9BC
MKLFFITDARFFQTPDGKFYAGEFSFSNILWERYLAEFNEVYVIARVFQVENFKNLNHLVSNVTLLPVVSFNSPLSYLLNKRTISQSIKGYFKKYIPDSVIIRGAGSLAYHVAKFCIKRKMVYGIEIIGDPYDVFAKGVIKHPLRPLLRNLFTKFQKEAVYNAKSVIYVTNHALQRRYPANNKAYSTFASDVFIEECITSVKQYPQNKTIKLLCIGSLEQMYKAPDIVLKAISKLIKEKTDVQLTWLGHGRFIEEMISLADSLQIAPNVNFIGSVSGKEVIEYLDKSDIFLLVSRTEGLPRAIVEAMARAVPCIGSDVGGIPELIHPDLLVEVENADDLSDKIRLIMNSEEAYSKYSEYSIQLASEFDFSTLENRRKLFFKSVKDEK